jgi:drug/metabolite transporter (DMT)-like permease
MTDHHLGDLLATVAALSWAVGVIFFKRAGEGLPPLAMNLFKGAVGLVLLTATLAAVGEPLVPDLPARTWLTLAASGVLGIAVSDTLFFASLNRLGAGLKAVVDTAYAPIILAMSYLWLGERLTPVDLVGAALITVALLVGSASRPPAGATRRDVIVGTALGLAGTVVTGVSVMMVKDLLETLPVLWATWVRLAAGTLSLLPVIALHPQRRNLFASLGRRAYWRWAVPAAFFGTYVAMACWIGGMKLADVSRAALLNQLATFFIIVFATLFLREPFGWRRGVAVALALAGALLVVL